MGDSQIGRLQSNIIDTRAYNFSSAAEHYYFTYHKLRCILENTNFKTKVVILGVSVHNFAPVYNRLFDLNFPEGKNSLKRYIYFLNFSNDCNFINSINQVLSREFISGIFSKPSLEGSIKSENSNPSADIINETFEMHYSIKRDENKFCFSQRENLYKIDSLCKVKNIELILISTPYHIKYKSQIKPEYFNFFTDVLTKLKHRKHINFLNDNPDPAFMSDANHLNVKGALYYCTIIRDQLNKWNVCKKYNQISKK